MGAGDNIQGRYQLGGNATVYPADAKLCGDTLTVAIDGGDKPLSRTAREGWDFGADIPGLPVEVRFSDGAVFTPTDADFRWPRQGRRRGWLTSIERNVPAVVAAALLTPLLFWWVVAIGMPAVAVHTVALIPERIPQEMGQQTLVILDRLYLDPTALDSRQQQQVQQVWDRALAALRINPSDYRLQFRASPQFGANALALPDGTVIVTDELVRRLDQTSDALLAVLLHEIGHVENRHSLKLVAQSVAVSLFFAVFLGDIEGAGELILGAGSSLMTNVFSREMETEADEFAFSSLEQLQISPAVFATALESIAGPGDGDQPAGQDNRQDTLVDYLSSHPATAERIHRARRRAMPAGDQGVDGP